MKNTKKKYKFKIIYIILMIFLIINFAVLVAILGRYVVNKVKENFERTKSFYFYSDKLGEDNPYYQIDNWSGVDDYTIVVNMNSYKNNLLNIDYDIEYEVSYICSDNVNCQLSEGPYIISSATNTNSFNIIVTPNRTLKDEETAYVEITAKTSTPYEAELKGRFTLKVGKEQLSYVIEDVAQRPYLEVDITNTLSYYTVNEAFGEYSKDEHITRDVYLTLTEENKNKCYSKIINIKFDPNVILLDMTDNAYVNGTSNTSTIINGKTYINSIEFKIDALSSQKVRFYKVDETKDYTYPIINAEPIVTLTSR